jgi:GNAT superfamily N-acetyltransferase
MPFNRNRLLWALRGAGLPSNLGQSIALQTAADPRLHGAATRQASQEQQRGMLLAGAIKSGSLKPGQLSASDLTLVRPNLDKGEFSGGFLSDIGDVLGNLGSDVWTAAKSLPGGVVHTAGALSHDVGNLPIFDPAHPTKLFQQTPKTYTDVVKPIGQQYAYTYGGVGAPEGSSFKQRVAEHPLGPLLDVLTVASLGSGGAIKGAQALAARGIGSESRPIQALVNAGRTTGRPSVTLNPEQQARAGVEFPEIPRRYSSRPLMKTGQITLDKLGELIGPLGERQTSGAVKRLQRETHAQGMAAQSAAVRAAVTPLVGSRRDLSTAESTALDYALRGWNTPDKIEASRQMFASSLRGELPEGWNISDFEGFFKSPEDARAFVNFKANLPPEIEQLITNPTPGMINAAQATKEAAEEGFSKLGLSEEEIAQRVGESQRILDDFQNGRLGQEPPPPEGPGGPETPPEPLGPEPQGPVGPEGPVPESWEGMQQGAEDVLGPQGPSGKGFDFERDLQGLKETAGENGVGKADVYALLHKYFSSPDELLDLPPTELGSLIDNTHSIIRPDQNAHIWGEDVHGLTDEEYAALNEEDIGSPELAEQASIDVARQLKDFKGHFPDWNSFLNGAFDALEGRAARGGSAPEGFLDLLRGALEGPDEVSSPEGDLPDFNDPSAVSDYIWRLNEELGHPLDFDEFGGTPDALYEDFRLDPPENHEEAIRRFEAFADDPQALFDEHFSDSPTLGDAVDQTSPQPPEGIEGKPWDSVTGADLRGMVLEDGPGLEESGLPSADAMDFEMVRQAQDKGFLQPGAPEGTHLVHSDHTPDGDIYVFVHHDARGEPVSMAEVGAVPRDPEQGFDNPGHIGDYQEFALSPDADLDALAQDIVDHFKGKQEPNLPDSWVPNTPEELQSFWDQYKPPESPDDVPQIPDTVGGFNWDQMRAPDQAPDTPEELLNLPKPETEYGDTVENTNYSPDVSEYIQRSDEANRRVEEPASQSFQDFIKDLDFNERFVDDETVDWPDEAYTEEGMNDAFFEQPDPEGVAYEKQWEPTLEAQGPGEPGFSHEDQFDAGPMASEVEDLVRGLGGDAEGGYEPKSTRNVTITWRDAEGKPGAVGAFTLNPDGTLADWGKYDGMYVRPDLRQQGLGSQMMEYVKDQFGLDLSDFIREGRQFTQQGAHFAWGYDAKRKGIDPLAQMTGGQFGGIPNVPDEPPPTDFEPPQPGGEPQGPIEPTYVPNVPAVGFQEQRPGMLARMFGADEQVFTRGRRRRQTSSAGVTAQNLFAESRPSYLRERPEVLASGAARVDPKSFVEAVARREKDLVSAGFDRDTVLSLAARNETGEAIKFQNQDEVHRRLGPDWVLVNEQFPIQWFSAESNFAQETVQTLEQLRQQGLSTHSPEVEQIINQLADSHARDFVRSAFNAQKLDGMAIPREYFNYQRRLVTASDPFDNAAGRVYARYMHRWRAYTLAYMPRWALNTAVGSFFLNMVKGVTPRDYMLASKLKGRGTFGEPRLGGVELGNVTGMEYLEPGQLGALERSTGVGVTPLGERIVEKVQSIEDHFRRASFVHSLNRVGQRRMAEMGQVISNLERRRGSIYDSRKPWSPAADEEYLQRLLDDPDAVKESIDDLNTFAYNFAALGPYERRYVRMAIPFWGWYKFITKVAYRLPVEYPGRANVLANLGMLGAGYEEELGNRPDWLQGIIPLGEEKGRLSYLSTLGQNPFGSFINPLSQQGAIEGALSLGQASPPIQALLSAFGLDTLRGGEVPISPEQGVAPDYFGSLIDIANQRETNPAQQAGLRRLAMGLLRSAPQFRMGEQYLAGGRSVYPESIPVLDPRPMPTDPKDTSLLSNIGQILGIAPKTYNLGGYQKGIKKRVKYARARNKTSMKRLKKATK